jgi:hypothetical protein
MNIVQALRHEAKNLEERLDRVRAAITALNGVGNGAGSGTGKYVRSAAARRKMSLAQKKRWAARRGK